MEFHKPFDQSQLARAAEYYRQGRKYIRLLHTAYAPDSAVERGLFRAIVAHLQDFGRELAKPNVKISVARLNELMADIKQLELKYGLEQRIRRFEQRT